MEFLEGATWSTIQEEVSSLVGFREGCYLDMFQLLQIAVGEGGLGTGFVDY